MHADGTAKPEHHLVLFYLGLDGLIAFLGLVIDFTGTAPHDGERLESLFGAAERCLYRPNLLLGQATQKPGKGRGVSGRPVSPRAR